MAFKGWPATALEFYEGLEADNSKVYWNDNKHVYEQHVRSPMEALLSELAAEFGEGKIFRPYRDVRFSADKAPYKTACGATVGHGYVQISADGLFVGSGMYHMMPDQLVRYRAAVASEGTGRELESLVGKLTRFGLDVHGTDALKTAPKGYPKDHRRVELLRYKGIVAAKQFQVSAWLGTARAKNEIAKALRGAGPLNEWLSVNVGPTEMDPGRG
ncbi:MAG TPA: DUF2461 domain-containing protein [Acidimicrobiales bacterium]|nr:DUF2461 domain-containing protein [Acidimicrobiales bacterium]